MTTFIGFGPNGQHENLIDENSPFPDGQPHIKLSADFFTRLSRKRLQVRARITSPVDLINIGLLVDVLRHHKPNIKIDLVLMYVWGRMDRRLTNDEPYTLRVIGNFINSLNLNSVSVFCPHSQATTDLFKRYVPFPQLSEDNFYDIGIVNCVRNMDDEMWNDVPQKESGFDIRQSKDLSIVLPDVGATKRLEKSTLLKRFPYASVVVMHKERDLRTGKIQSVRILQGDVKKNCVFVDDLCDGGATFTFGQKPLREAGAKHVGLVVAHGVFSKGDEVEGIDYIYTTNSFKDWTPHRFLGVSRYV